MNTVITPILQIGTLGCQEVEYIVQSHTAIQVTAPGFEPEQLSSMPHPAFRTTLIPGGASAQLLFQEITPTPQPHSRLELWGDKNKEPRPPH